jgi:hypothetical protein
MIVALIVLIPLLAGALYIYLKFPPPNDPARPQNLRWFNCGLFLAAILGCAGIGFYFKTAMSGSSDAGWWPMLTVLCSLLFSTAVLLVGGVVRSLVFKKRP